MELLSYIILVLFAVEICKGEKIAIPSFQKLKLLYPGHKHFGGQFSHRVLKEMIGITEHRLLHDTSALRLSYSLNKIGDRHSLGQDMIRLSKAGRDSVSGTTGLQYIYNPIAFGPYLADKYGYPNVSVLHQTDPIATKKRFYGKQGILEIITYTKRGNKPRGHIALWDCDHIHQEKDWISKHHLITVEFWQSPDSNCMMKGNQYSNTKDRTLFPAPFGVPRVDTFKHRKFIKNKRKSYKKVKTHNNAVIRHTVAPYILPSAI